MSEFRFENWRNLTLEKCYIFFKCTSILEDFVLILNERKREFWCKLDQTLDFGVFYL